MGIFGVIKGAKNVVKAAKNKLEKVVSDKGNQGIDEGDDVSKRLSKHIRENAEMYISAIEPLLEETTDLVKTINEMQGNKLKLTEKFKLSKIKNKATENLEYLYLAKEWLSLLDRTSTGIKLSYMQSQFIYKFSPFFDGRKVLTYDDSEYEEDDSIWGDIKESFSDIKEFFVSSEKLREFSFDEFLESYNDKINAFKIPDFKIIFKKIRGSNESVDKKKNETLLSIGTMICNSCSFAAPSGSKFCPSCGAPFEESKFCVNCGEKIVSGAKFCAKCGSKVE
ncbi:MAG: zinc-ribbon domain-containing protein [Acholeplasmatales bacterium]|nr:zinc-ribbon domain-containing protein [Acholeplasmatales bacterium]